MKRSHEKTGALLVHAQHALHVLQKDVAELLGVSRKTVQRWTAGHPRLTPTMLVTLTSAVHPKDPALAERIAAAYETTLEEMGVVVPPAPATPPPDPTPPAPPERPPRDPSAERILADALVCAAAEMADVSPRLMRPALVAALARAREARLTVEEAHALLAAATAKTEAKKK